MAIVDYNVDSQVAMITLNNSVAGNLLNQESLMALNSAFSLAYNDEQVRVVVLRSNADSFCLGMDLRQLLNHQPRSWRLLEENVALYVQLLSGIYTAAKPVICLVQGAVKAGGIGLVGACDLVLVSECASFQFTEVLWGLIPANALPFIYSLRLAPQKLRYLILAARTISAGEAQQLNLVDEVFKDEQLASGLTAVPKTLFRASPEALTETKRFTQLIFGKSMAQSCALAKKKLIALLKRPETLRAIQAFNEGGVPSWFGKFKPEKPLLR